MLHAMGIIGTRACVKWSQGGPPIVEGIAWCQNKKKIN